MIIKVISNFWALQICIYMQTIEILILEHSNLSSASFTWQQSGNYVAIIKVQNFQSFTDYTLK